MYLLTIDETHWFALFTGILFTSISQLLLRSGARSKPTIVQSNFNLKVLFGYTLFFIVTILNLYALQRIQLKTLTAWASVGYILTPVLAQGVLKESITRNNIIGGIIIMFGIVVFSFGDMY